MNKEIIQKEVTLDAIQSIVTMSIAESIKGLATMESVNNSLKGLATHEEVKSLQQQFTDMKTTVVSQAVDFKKHVDGLTLSIDDLPTRSELNSLEKHLEGQIDDLAISVKRGFDEVHIELKRVHVRLDEMDKHLVMFEEESKMRLSAIQNQLDAIHGQYPNRSEHTFLEKRVKRVEKVVFA